jgi:hypothetical protein
MAETTGANRRSASDWRTLVSELADSGEDLPRFCRRRGIYPPTLRWWRWRLRSSPGDLESSPQSEPRAALAKRPQFTELRLKAAAVPAEADAAVFALHWPDGLTLTIPQDFDAAALQRLLSVLEVAGC